MAGERLRSRWLCIVAVALIVAAIHPSTVAAVPFTLHVRDADGGWPLPARVRVRDAVGVDHVPEGALTVPIGKSDRWFVCDGRAQLDLPAGPVELRIERGTEYSPHMERLELAGDQPVVHTVTLRRWINMRQRGMVCGENHLHVPVDQLAPQLVAEGLDFGTSLQWWNEPQFDVPAGDGFIRVLEFAGRRVPTTVFDFEVEHKWGAAYAVGVPEPLKRKATLKIPNLPLVRSAHQAGALVAYQAGYSREALLDALLGYVDVINVCSNNFHRHRFQPRSRYSNMLNVEGLPVYPDTAEGMMRLSMESYYRLLNCGLRLAAGAESATGAKNNPVGYNRTYVRAGENPTLADYLDAWRAGRNFVTCGPMLFLKIDGRHEPGDTIELPAEGGELTIEVEAIADQPLTSLEVVVNGRVIAARPEIQGSIAKLTTRATLAEGSWIAARCTERDDLLTDDELAAYDTGENARPARLRFAHTSPVYVTVGGRGPRVEQAIAEAGRMLDAFEKFAMQTAGRQYHDELRQAVQQARERLARP